MLHGILFFQSITDNLRELGNPKWFIEQEFVGAQEDFLVRLDDSRT